MKYVIVHIIKNRVVGFAKCKTKKEVLEFAEQVQKYIKVTIHPDYLWANRHHPITEHSCLEIL